MRRRSLIASMAVLASGFTMLAAAPAQAATGTVAVFSTEFQPLDVADNPTGCVKLPITAHVLSNLTDAVVTVYADPSCTIQLLTIQPGYGSHVIGTGSYSVGG